MARLAYVVSAYKLPRNLVRLVRRLSHDGEPVVIHVDRRTSPGVHQAMREPLAALPNVHFLPRHSSVHAGYGHVLTTLKGLRHLHDSGAPYDYVVLLTGQDYPIKPLPVIRAQFARNPQRSYMEHFRVPAQEWDGGGMNRLTHWHYWTPRGLRGIRRSWLGPLVPQHLPGNPVLWGGSGYWTMCRRHAEYVLDFVRETPAYARFFRRASVPDEIFFHTILLNSPHADEVINDDMRFIDWERTEIPAIFDSSDLELLSSRPEPFARKFDSTRDESILDALDDLAIEAPPR